MYTSDIRTGMKYLAASILIAAAAAVYGLFSHGVYSYYKIYAFMIPLLAGALPHLAAAMKKEGQIPEKGMTGTDGHEVREETSDPGILNDARLAFVTTLTAGSLLKGALDIYGTTNRLLIVYPVIAVVILAVQLAKRFKSQS